MPGVLSWGSACLGLASKGAETAQALGLLLVFPITFVSNSLVPTGRMTPWLRDVTTWNPISAVTAAARQLFGTPTPPPPSTPGPCSTPSSPPSRGRSGS